MLLKEKVQYALDESRMLILGIEVLLGFGFQAFFMRAFQTLPAVARALKLFSLALLCTAILLVLLPVARHRLVDHGRDSLELEQLTHWTATLALLPFALALGIDVQLVICRSYGLSVGTVGGALTTSLALLLWYALPCASRREHAHTSEEDKMEETQLNDKVCHVLTEARVVLPGTQALLGFQFAAALQDGFDDLSFVSKNVHLVGLAFLAVSVILLMLPAAFHRIAEHGEISERFHRVSGVCILGAMAALAGGLAASIFVVVQKTLGSWAATAAAASWLLVSLSGWFGVMFVLRARRGAATGLTPRRRARPVPRYSEGPHRESHRSGGRCERTTP